jgi:hypothetical protein
MAYGAIRLDRIQATKDGAIKNIKGSVDLQNGFVMHLEDLAPNEREVYTVVQPATATVADKPIYIHASVELMYEVGKTITDFVLTAGKVGRAIRPQVGDVITITDNVISGTTVVGQYVAPQDASYQLATSATIPTTKFVGKVIAKENIYGQPATVIEVLAN